MHFAINYLSYALLFLALLDHGKAQNIGSRCTLSRGNGICRLITRCPWVYAELVRGNRPEKMCGFNNRVPIVCCPIGNPVTTTATTRSVAPPIFGDLNRPARLMCAQYARSLLTTVRLPALNGGDEQLVNVSLADDAVQKLIIGGTKAAPREFPYMAAVGYMNGAEIRWDCGGTLISESFVLTAAHCTSSIQWGTARWIRVGDLNLQSTADDAQPQDRQIVQWIRYPNYRVPAQYNDIALLRLQRPVQFTPYVRPACLDVTGNHPPGQVAVATGWGIVDWFDSAGSPDLRKVYIPIVAYPTCAGYYTDESNRLPNGINDQSQLCAGAQGKDTCQGDSGGPLAIFSATQRNMYDLIGVTSFGQFCGSVSPGIYTRVIYYVSWIESVVWPNMG